MPLCAAQSRRATAFTHPPPPSLPLPFSNLRPFLPAPLPSSCPFAPLFLPPYLLMMASTTTWTGFWSVSRCTISNACLTMRTCTVHGGRGGGTVRQVQPCGQCWAFENTKGA